MYKKLMYKKDRWQIRLLGIALIILGVFLDVKIPEKLFSDLITFISILVGFQIAAFSILFTSSSVKRLYQFKDKENQYITTKHRLKNYYKFGFNLALLSIVIIFILQIVEPSKIHTKWFEFDLSWISRSSVFCIIGLNILAVYKTVNFLYMAFMKDNE